MEVWPSGRTEADFWTTGQRVNLKRGRKHGEADEDHGSVSLGHGVLYRRWVSHRDHRPPMTFRHKRGIAWAASSRQSTKVRGLAMADFWEPGEGEDRMDLAKEVVNVCPDCKHSLKDNLHGPGQNDFEWDSEGNMSHCGRCTYCRECNPRIFEKGSGDG